MRGKADSAFDLRFTTGHVDTRVYSGLTWLAAADACRYLNTIRLALDARCTETVGWMLDDARPPRGRGGRGSIRLYSTYND